jgi:4-hydroxyphenylpyruvate dioxygenase
VNDHAVRVDLFDNPLGLDGFEFVEFTAPQPEVLEPVFAAMGFTHIASHRSKRVQLWRQGYINLIANYEPSSPAAFFAVEHGPSACGMGWRCAMLRRLMQGRSRAALSRSM